MGFTSREEVALSGPYSCEEVAEMVNDFHLHGEEVPPAAHFIRCGFAAQPTTSRSEVQQQTLKTTANVDCLRPGFRKRVRRWLRGLGGLGISYRVTSACRSRRTQTVLYQRRQRGAHPLPVARPGTSLHELGRAVDVVFPPTFLPLAVEFARFLEIRWAGPRDPVHFDDA